MAFTDTVLLDARTAVKTSKRFELRPKMSKAIEASLKYRDESIVDLAQIKQATTQTTTALHNSKTTYTVSTGGKGCTPTGTEGATKSVDLTWVTRTVTPFVEHKVHAGNELKMQEAFNVSFYNALESLFFSGTNSIDAYLIARLEANKSSVNNGTIGTFDTYGDDVMVIANSDKDEFYNIVATEMQENNFTPNFQNVYNTGWERWKNKYINQGAGNSENTAYQFNGFEFYPSNNVDAANSTYYTGGMHYVFPTGAVSLIDWSENDATGQTGVTVGERTWGSMDGLFFPEIKLDTMTYQTCVDSTARGGGPQDIRTTVEITANIAVVVEPLASGTPIFKYGIPSA